MKKMGTTLGNQLLTKEVGFAQGELEKVMGECCRQGFRGCIKNVGWGFSTDMLLRSDTTQSLHFVSDAGAGLIRPFQLNRIIPDLFGLPGANVADLTVNVIVPALSRDRV